MNDIQNVTKQTPIEIALGIDEDGKSTASKLYDFLELSPSNYSKWCKTNITENRFAEENVDFVRFVIQYESGVGTKDREDFKLSANFAKKLSMQGKTEKAEQARNYFIAVEGKLKEIATKGMSHNISRLTITSRELIKIAGLRHNTHAIVVKNIRDCIEELRKTNFIAEDFFIESEYAGANNQMHTQFLCTEQGCIYYTSHVDMDRRDAYREEVHFRFLQLQDMAEGKPIRQKPKEIVEEKDWQTLISIYKNNDWGILVMGGEIYNLTPEEYKELSGLVPKLQEMNVKQIPSVIEAYLALHERKRKLESTIEIKYENAPTVKALPDNTAKPQKRTNSKDGNGAFITVGQAMNRYNMCRENVVKLARESESYIKYGNMVRYDTKKMDAYLSKEYAE